MLAGFPMKFLHFKQFVDHMNVEYGNGLSLIVVTHAVASLSTRLRHSKVKVLGNGHLAMSSTEKTKKQQIQDSYGLSKKQRIPMENSYVLWKKNNEFL
jgi:hypothetical protein